MFFDRLKNVLCEMICVALLLQALYQIFAMFVSH